MRESTVWANLEVGTILQDKHTPFLEVRVDGKTWIQVKVQGDLLVEFCLSVEHFKPLMFKDEGSNNLLCLWKISGYFKRNQRAES